ncbi:MAG: nucleotide exchange factor GrpE [Halobacteriales archaeon]|nr:nucleotide exchange factor GrpE [Halobacteriales archaeon]
MTDAEADADAEPGAADDEAPAESADGTQEVVETDPAHDELVAEVAAHDEALAGEVGDLASRVATLEAELADQSAEAEELESKLKRARADFQNYKKRVKEREAQLKERATEDLVERLLDVRDNLVRALEQDEDADIRDGVEATLASFDRVLADENVSSIEPEPGAEVDPERHEVVLREEDGEQPPGTIERSYRPGYELAGSVLRPAQVTVSEADE